MPSYPKKLKLSIEFFMQLYLTADTFILLSPCFQNIIFFPNRIMIQLPYEQIQVSLADISHTEMLQNMLIPFSYPFFTPPFLNFVIVINITTANSVKTIQCGIDDFIKQYKILYTNRYNTIIHRTEIIKRFLETIFS